MEDELSQALVSFEAAEILIFMTYLEAGMKITTQTLVDDSSLPYDDMLMINEPKS